MTVWIADERGCLWQTELFDCFAVDREPGLYRANGQASRHGWMNTPRAMKRHAFTAMNCTGQAYCDLKAVFEPHNSHMEVVTLEVPYSDR